MAAGWRKFFMLKRELTTRSYSLRDRLRLFHGTITPTVLYESASWTLSLELENRVRRTQRQMLRMILGAPRRRHVHVQHLHPPAPQQPTPVDQHHTDYQPTPTPRRPSDELNTSTPSPDTSDVDSEPPANDIPDDEEADIILEPWVDWVHRCTYEAEAYMAKLHINDWVHTQQQRKHHWATCVEQDKHKWSHRALQWDPPIHAAGQAQRRQGRPKTRWIDSFQKFQP